MNPPLQVRLSLAAVKKITLHLYATTKYCRTQKACQVKIITNCLFVIINDGDKCVIANLNIQQQNNNTTTYNMFLYCSTLYLFSPFFRAVAFYESENFFEILKSRGTREKCQINFLCGTSCTK